MTDSPTAQAAPRKRGGGIVLAIVALIVGVLIGVLTAPSAKTPASCKRALDTADSIFGRIGGDLSAGKLSPATSAFVTAKTNTYKTNRDSCESH